jgi:hypothetical protein
MPLWPPCLPRIIVLSTLSRSFIIVSSSVLITATRTNDKRDEHTDMLDCMFQQRGTKKQVPRNGLPAFQGTGPLHVFISL